MKKTRIRIYDMDGTIVCSMHRYKIKDNGKIDLNYWRDNEPLAYKDKLLPLAAQYKADLVCEKTIVIIATARVLNDPDECFIRDILGSPNAIISRRPNDTRSGGELKIKGLRRLFNLKGFKGIKDIIFYEDNATYLKTVCDYFKPLGMLGLYVPSEQGH